MVLRGLLTTSAACDDCSEPFDLEEAGRIDIRGVKSHTGVSTEDNAVN